MSDESASPLAREHLDAVLLQHGRSAVLFDTGYSDHFRAETKSFPNALYARLMPPRFDGADRACDQLRRFGIDPADVRAIVVSHFHADHIAGLRDFPKARILCAGDGYQAIRTARGLGGLMGGLLPGASAGVYTATKIAAVGLM